MKGIEKQWFMGEDGSCWTDNATSRELSTLKFSLLCISIPLPACFHEYFANVLEL